MLSRFLTLLQLSTANPAADSQEIVRHITLLILFVVAVVLPVSYTHLTLPTICSV